MHRWTYKQARFTSVFSEVSKSNPPTTHTHTPSHTHTHCSPFFFQDNGNTRVHFKYSDLILVSILKGCGYGCQIHHVVYCFIVAYGTQRTLILKSKGWRYDRKGWEDVFQPLSETCSDSAGISFAHWPGEDTSLPLIKGQKFQNQKKSICQAAILIASINTLHQRDEFYNHYVL